LERDSPRSAGARPRGPGEVWNGSATRPLGLAITPLAWPSTSHPGRAGMAKSNGYGNHAPTPPPTLGLRPVALDSAAREVFILPLPPASQYGPMPGPWQRRGSSRIRCRFSGWNFDDLTKPESGGGALFLRVQRPSAQVFRCLFALNVCLPVLTGVGAVAAGIRWQGFYWLANVQKLLSAMKTLFPHQTKSGFRSPQRFLAFALIGFYSAWHW